jgi:transposase InsO family protein
MVKFAWHILLVAVAGWMNQQQQELIEYLKEENRILREKLGPGRILLNPVQKRRLATAAFRVGRKLLQGCATLFSPDTLLRWHRTLVARKYDGSGKRGPQPKKANEVRKLVLRMKQENDDWGYGHIHGELKKLGYQVSWQTVRRIMKEHGLLDEPDRPKRMSWTTFIKAHFESMSACDFFTVEAWTPKGLTRFLVFFAIDVASRKVRICGIDEYPDEEWMLQQARNLTDPVDGFLKDKAFLIHDRDPLFTKEFRKVMRAGGIRTLKMPKQSPNLNAYSERFVQSIKMECLDKMILFGQKHLRHVVEQYAEQYYNHERPHQGLGNRTIVQPAAAPLTRGRVFCRERLGGLLKSYYRKAA